MSIKKYKALVYSVEEGTLTKAGEKLGSSQTAITHLIADLEKQTGEKLIVRNKNGVKLTSFGKKLYPYIKEVVVADDNVSLAINKLKTQSNYTISVGTFSSVAVNWLPNIISGFKKLYPEVNFNIIDGGYGDIINAINNGIADIGFISTGDEESENVYPLVKDRILALLPKGHKFANEKYFNVENFKNEPIISLNEKTDFDSRRIFEKAGIIPDIRYRTSDDYAMISMVENNMGICLTPELLIANRNLNVKAKELNPPAYRTIALKTSSTVNEIVMEFKNFVIDWVNKNFIK